MSQKEANGGATPRPRKRVSPKVEPPAAPGTDLVQRPDDAVLIPVPDGDPETFMVLAEHWDETAFPLDKAFMLSAAAQSNLQSRIVRGTGLANVGLQGLNGMQSVQGLVRLAPETIKLMQAGATPLTSGGANLGTLASGGKIVAQVRWAPAAGASAVGVMAAMGPAIALAAIQFQLASMDKKLDQIIDISDEILRSLRVEFWTEVETSFARLRRLWNHAIFSGDVSAHLMDEARGQSWVLSHRRSQMLEEVRVRVAELERKRTAKERNEWLTKNAGIVMRDVQCLVLASAGCQMYDLMWAQFVSQTDPELAGRIVADALDQANRDKETIASAVTDLVRKLELLAADPGKERIYMFGLDTAPEKALNSARRLSKAIGDLGMSVEQPHWGHSKVVALASGSSGYEAGRKAIATMKWHLTSGEILEEVWVGKSSYLCLTNSRLFSCPRKSPSSMRWWMTWQDISHVHPIKDFGDHNVEIMTSTGVKHRFEIGGGESAQGLARSQGHELLVRAGSSAERASATSMRRRPAPKGLPKRSGGE